MSQYVDTTERERLTPPARRARGRPPASARAARWLKSALRKPLRQKATGVLLAIFGVITLGSIAMTQLTEGQQVTFAICSFLLFYVVNKYPGRGVSLFLVALSMTVSMRYMVWRVTTTLDFQTLPAAFLGTGLVLAEFYALLVMVLGYLQTTWVLERKPVPISGTPDTWPTVDVYIPTYNEDLEIVRATVLACMSIDYPAAKMRVYILDDGKRQVMRDFAEECGAGYIARTDNAHAKAGNLNHALGVTDGEYIAIFDCDHIPTRAFLQMSLGWLIRDPKMALVQTPHHFYTPDPFERNLATGMRVPNEGNMFYGLVQPGNDFWNAAFFCGSCAVLRRTAIESINGFAVETVTEDAHTALRLHRNGWNSAYLKVPLAAGLATERLSAHIGQRARWARGMIQILRLDCPLFGPGLTIGQRFCYLAAMAAFLYPLPRLVFLTSPLAFLLMGQNIIAASPLAIVAYAGPHIMHTVATNSRLQKNWRHSFWSEVYETVLALTLVRPTTTALFDPSRGKFNVTAKGTIIEQDYFDVGAVRMNLILAAVLVAGLLRGIWGVIFTPDSSLAFQAYLLNSIWVIFSLTTVFCAIAVGKERQQPRRRPRLEATLPAFIVLRDGSEIAGVTRDISRGGVSIAVKGPLNLAARTAIRVILPVGGAKTSITARLLYTHNEGDEVVCGISFKPANIIEETAVIRAAFGRADAWVNWNPHPIDRPMHSLWDMLVSVVGVFNRPKVLPEAALVSSDEAQSYEVTDGVAPVNDLRNSGTVVRPRRALSAGAALCILLPVLALHAASAQAQIPGGAPNDVLPANPPLPTLPSIVLQQAPAAAPPAGEPGAAQPNTGQPVPLTSALGSAPVAAPAAPISQPSPPPAAQAQQAAPQAAPQAAASSRTLVLTLKQLGAAGPLTLRGISTIQGLMFGIRADEVVTGALLTMNGAMSPALIPALSNVTVTLNEQYVGTIPVNASQPQFGPLTMNINPAFFLPQNRLNFRFTGQYTTGCNDPLSPLLWSTLSDSSTLTLILTRLPPAFDLSALPAPFFDPHERLPLKLAFVLPAQPSDEELQAAGITASWFGGLADFRGAQFTASNDAPQTGNAIVIAVGADGAADLSLPQFQGPTLAEIPNPNDPSATLLVIGGQTGDDVLAAAQQLTLGSRLASGANELVTAPDMPAHAAYDAPNWVPLNRKVALGELVAAPALNGAGYSDVLNVPFQTAPDLYNWRQQPFPLHLLFQAPPGPVLDVATSHLDVAINGNYLASSSLAPKFSLLQWVLNATGFAASTGGEHRFTVNIPPYDVFAQNQLQMTFDTRPLNRGACKAIPDDIRYAIDPTSTLDLSSAYHFSAQPRLGFFRSAGFPFSIYADFSQSAVVLPAQPDGTELGAYLSLMGRFGRITGYPTERVLVLRPSETEAMASRHLLVIANMAQAPDIAPLLSSMPVQLDGSNLSVPLPGVLDEIGQVFGGRIAIDRRRSGAILQGPLGGNDAILMSAQSPLASGKTETVLLSASSLGLSNLVTSLDDPNLQTQIQGDLTVFAGGTVTSYRIGPSYWIGWIPPWLWPTWFLRGRPDIMLLMLVGACLITAVGLYWPMRRRSARRLSARKTKK